MTTKGREIQIPWVKFSQKWKLEEQLSGKMQRGTRKDTEERGWPRLCHWESSAEQANLVNMMIWDHADMQDSKAQEGNGKRHLPGAEDKIDKFITSKVLCSTAGKVILNTIQIEF